MAHIFSNDPLAQARYSLGTPQGQKDHQDLLGNAHGVAAGLEDDLEDLFA